MRRSKAVTFLLGVIPGLPQIYLGYSGRGILIMALTAFYTLGVIFLAAAVGSSNFLVLLLPLPFVWLGAWVDAFLLFPGRAAEPAQQLTGRTDTLQRELLILAALVPGGGQMYLGEMDRGLPLAVFFFGWLTFVGFLAAGVAGGFITLWGLLPIIWVYSFFDALEGWRARERGVGASRPGLVAELDTALLHGGRSGAVAAALSLVPGVGHMYLGQMEKGLSLLGGFLLVLFVNNLLRLNLAFVVLPLLWFYSAFDVLGELPLLAQTSGPNAARFSSGNQRTVQRWLGYALVGAGLLLLVDRLLVPQLDPRLVRYLQPVAVAVILMVVGVRLLLGTRVPGRAAEKGAAGRSAVEEGAAEKEPNENNSEREGGGA